MRIVFLDISCPEPYDAETLATKPIGGTEATCIRIAESLSAHGHEVYVAQHNRRILGQGDAAYVPCEALEGMVIKPELVVGLRTPKTLPWLANRFPDSKKILWMHDFNVNEVVEDAPMLQDIGTKILGVSRFHKTKLIDALLPRISGGRITVDFIYNPIIKVGPSGKRNPNKLVYFSSPHKGLDQTLGQFKHVRRNIPGLRLYVANPGYVKAEMPNMAGVSYLGELTHSRMMDELSDAFAVFHMNRVFPETFGLVHAEANERGVAVMTGGLGANREIMGDCPDQFVDVRNTKQIIERLERWQRDYPNVKGNPEFYIQNVVKKWEGLAQ